MDIWYSDNHTDNINFSIRIDKQLFSIESPLQRIDIFSSVDMGRVLVSDGDLIFTEKDEFIYHEMITHVPMAVHPNVRKVLVIGGGDGGVVRELIKYKDIEKIDVVEPDKIIVDVCNEFFPEIAGSLKDPRVSIFYEDGLRFIRSKTDSYDLIIIDSPNPFGAGEGLFTKEFYGNCYNALHDDGIMINQNECPFYEEESYQCQRMHNKIVKTFPICKVYQAHIPSYPSGHWLFGFASKLYHPVKDLNKIDWYMKGIKTRYYQPTIHEGVFALPVYVEDLLKNVE